MFRSRALRSEMLRSRLSPDSAIINMYGQVQQVAKAIVEIRVLNKVEPDLILQRPEGLTFTE